MTRSFLSCRRSGRLKMELVDQAVARVLRVKFALGLFERPYTDEKLSASRILTPEHIELARHAAEESFVLLKNDPVHGKPLLPLAEGKTVALIGPLADSQADMFGAWVMKGDPKNAVTLRQVAGRATEGQLMYARGVDTRDESEARFGEALAAAARRTSCSWPWARPRT